MRTPTQMMNAVLKARKDKKKKGFSLVELIVVLVIMAILMAALIPSLTGYIRQARQNNVKTEASQCLQGLQTVVSSCYGDPNGTYTCQTDQKTVIITAFGATSGTTGSAFTEKSGEGGETSTLVAEAKELAEVDGTISDVKGVNGVVTDFTYTNKDSSQVVTYSNGKYTVTK